MITANVIHRVFRIQCGTARGTAFTLDVHGRQYLVTARHVVHGLQGNADISLFSNGAWASLPVRLVGHGSADIDISVMAPSRLLTLGTLPMEPMDKGVIYGQDVYFLGFPYDFIGKHIFGPDGYPLPFVKKATVSLFDGAVFFLDGHNNPGFSGGPVIFTEPSSREYKVAAVVSGYQAVSESVYAGHERTPLTYQYNTGIIVTHAINGALKLVEDNPIGITIDGAA